MMVFPQIVIDVCRPTEPAIEITRAVGCYESHTSHTYQTVWAPGVCQPLPGDANSMMTMGCTADTADDMVEIQVWENASDCAGEPTRMNLWRSGKKTISEEQLMQDTCTMLVFPQSVVDACAPAQPDGPDLSLTFVDGCTIYQTTEEMPIVWAPGQCQRSPFDATQSMILECDPQVNGGLRMKQYNGFVCQFNPVSDYTVQNNKVYGPDGGSFLGPNAEYILAEDSCMRYELPQTIIDACTVPTAAPTAGPTRAPTGAPSAEPTVPPTNAPSVEPTAPCLNVVELANKRKYKKLCKEFKEGPEGICTAAGCRFKEKFSERRQKWKRSCKPKRNNQLSCGIISADHCCKFPGCAVDGSMCVGVFEGFEN